jgi:hypothetical protein
MSTRSLRYRVKFFNSDAGQDRGCPPFRFAGPFDGVQLTYDTMRETAKGDTIADYHEDLGGWKFDGDTFTDAVIESQDAPPDALAMLCDALPYVEEGEQFNKPTCRGLSKKIRAALALAEGSGEK